MFKRFRSQVHQTRSIKFHFVVMDVIGVFTCIFAATFEDDGTILLIDVHHFANHPFAFRDLIFDGSLLGIEQIQMVPAVAFRHPNDFLGVFQVVAVMFSAVFHIRLAFFFDQNADGARGSVHFNHLIQLVSTLVELEGEVLAVWCPVCVTQIKLIFKSFRIDGDLRGLFNIEQARTFDRQCVTRFQVVAFLQNWLKLRFG